MAAGSPSGIICPATINGLKASLLVDSGSQVTCLSPQSLSLLNLDLVSDPRVFTPCGDGNEVKSPGYVVIRELRVGRFTLRNLHLPVCDIHDACTPAHGILGLDLFGLVGISVVGVPITYPEEEAESILSDEPFFNRLTSLEQYAPTDAQRQLLLDKLKPQLECNRAIPVGSFCSHPSAVVRLDTGDAKPVYTPQYRVSDYMSSFIDKQVTEWDASAVTLPAPVDCPWNSPVIGAQDRAARRKGKDPRVCIDPRPLNRLLPSDPRGIPTVQSVHATLHGFTHVTEIDLTKSFNQFMVFPADQPKTAFTWRGTKRMFQGAPFGLKPLSQIFQSVIEQILSDVRHFACPFIDNIYVYTTGSFDEHVDRVAQVLDLLNKYNLRVNEAKCFFGYRAINCLGHIISGTTKAPDPSKIQALAEWPVPVTGTDVEAFLGFTNYLRDFIPCYADVAAPLEKLRKVKKVKAAWDADCQRAFNFFRGVLSKVPYLSTPLPDVEFQLQTDASQFGLGWVLYQTDPSTGQTRYIQFGAKALNSAQINYGASRRELLAIVVALNHCRDYLYGRHFTLYTDHKSLSYLFTQPKLNYAQLNWLDTLLDFDFTVCHRPGIEMVLPDALSRMYSQFRGGSGPKIRALRTTEFVNHPDKELTQFINDRFNLTFVPSGEREAKLTSAHENGHFGAESLFKRLWTDGFYWPGMRADCNNHVNSCLSCLRFNIGKAGFHPRQSIDASLPFEHIAVDTFSGLVVSPRGHNYVLVITDLCTRYKLLIPQQSKSAAETARNLWAVFCTFPLPKIIQSDNGTEFCNSVIQEMSELLGVNHKQITAYNPRANGTAENAVGNAQQVLRKLTNGLIPDWDLFIPAVQLAINSKVNDSTKSSPASLLFGMNVNAFANYDRATSKLLTTHQLLERAKLMQDLVRPEALQVFRARQAKRTKQVNDKLVIAKPIPTGALVMLKDPTRSTKHDPYWIGPFRVVDRKRGGNYVLQNVDHSLYHRQPPRDHLKVIDAKAEVPFDDIYYVERILDHRGPPSRRSYLVKWLNYPASQNTWEPESNLSGSAKFLNEYWSTRTNMNLSAGASSRSK